MKTPEKLKTKLKTKLKEFYYATGIPVAFAKKYGPFNLLYPQAKNPPYINHHTGFLFNIVDQYNLSKGHPIICTFKNSMFFSILPITDDILVQIGPVSSHNIDFNKYITQFSQNYTSEQILFHINVLKGAPQVDLHFFLNTVILAVDLLCDMQISEDDVVFDSTSSLDNNEEIHFHPPVSPINISQISFSSTMYSYIEKGNLELLESMQKRLVSASEFYFQDNDVSSLRAIFISYAAIACRHAVIGGAKENSVQIAFGQFLTTLNKCADPSEFWIILPQFSQTLCKLVRDELKDVSVSDPIIEKCIHFINANIYRRITISDLEKHTGISRRTLLRRFDSAYKISPSQYIANLKIEEAENLLINTDLKIADIAAMLDYSSQSHLNKAFQKKYGCTPLEYRRNHI